MCFINKILFSPKAFDENNYCSQVKGGTICGREADFCRFSLDQEWKCAEQKIYYKRSECGVVVAQLSAPPWLNHIGIFMPQHIFRCYVLHLPHPRNPTATCQCVLNAAQTSLCVEWIPLMPFVASFSPPFMTCLLLLRMALIQTVWSVPFRLLSLRFFSPVSCGIWLLRLFFLFFFFLSNCNLGFVAWVSLRTIVEYLKYLSHHVPVFLSH